MSPGQYAQNNQRNQRHSQNQHSAPIDKPLQHAEMSHVNGARKHYRDPPGFKGRYIGGTPPPILPGAIVNIQPEEHPEEVNATPSNDVQLKPNGYADIDGVNAIMNPYTINIIQE
jgi:hypothetical protein